MYNTLFILDYNPEEQKRLIVPLSKEEYNKYKNAYNVYVNTDNKEEDLAIEIFNNAENIWAKHISNETTHINHVNRLICVGWYL